MTHLEDTTPWVRRWLRAEGVAALALGWVAWQGYGGELLWFVPALLLPDVSMAGYLGGNHTGAIAYNLAHNWFVGGIVLGLGWWLSVAPLALAGAVLVAHRVATADPARQRRGKQLPEGAADVADELDLGLVLRVHLGRLRVDVDDPLRTVGVPAGRRVLHES